MNDKKRGSFSGHIGFILAAAGSAIGLGNMWRFPYLAAQYGGGIFILVYILLALTFGFTLMTTEIAIGRKTGLSPIQAYKVLDSHFGFLGYLTLLVPTIILPYYCVIGGWVIKYMFSSIAGTPGMADSSFFGSFIGMPSEPVAWFLVFLALVAIVVVSGVEKGIERISKLLMPFLLLLTIGISIYVITIPGSMDGLKYYLLPDFSNFSLKTVCAAMGQMFFSMSIAMGIMVTYGSYTPKEVCMSKSVNQIEFFDTLVAFLAGLMIIPAVFVFSGEEGLASGGPGLMFITLPKVFDSMAGGRIIGSLFFILVFLAALTSAISVMEAIVSMVIDRWKMSRRNACLFIFVLCICIGIPTSLGNGMWANLKILGMDLLTFFDYLSNSVLMPIVALCTSIMVGWVIGPKVICDEVTRNGEKFAREKIFNIMVRYVAPILLVVILVFYNMAQFGFIQF
ncbi:MAG: sodium-dependent transporter [Clostridiales bacterium]|nr:sodium-dependent transporter [Clostridiales bacterium]